MKILGPYSTSIGGKTNKQKTKNLKICVEEQKTMITKAILNKRTWQE